jgi:hypothetical protein
MAKGATGGACAQCRSASARGAVTRATACRQTPRRREPRVVEEAAPEVKKGCSTTGSSSSSTDDDCRPKKKRKRTNEVTGPSSARRAASRYHRCTTSKYRGVLRNKLSGKWMAQIIPPNKCKQHLGTFTDEADAARAYDDRARQLLGAAARLNFPRAGEKKAAEKLRMGERAKAAQTAAVTAQQGRMQCASKYRGVTYDKRNGKWTAQACKEHLGTFINEADAARAHDAKARQVLGAAARLNFPRAGEKQAAVRLRMDASAKAAQRALVAARWANGQTASKYRGVGFDRRSGMWRAAIKTHKIDGRGHFVGEHRLACCLLCSCSQVLVNLGAGGGGPLGTFLIGVGGERRHVRYRGGCCSGL